LTAKIALAATLLAVVSCVGRPDNDATGEEIYLQLCANCHASDLSGGIGPALGPGSEASSQPDEFLVAAIHDGRGRMPSFRSSLDDEQLDRLIAYLRDEQAK
jgi:cytochrome c551